MQGINISHTDVFMIDEYSMMKNTLLEKLNEILCDLADNVDDMKKPFGNKSIIFFGDISQLPPVIKDRTSE